MVDGVQRMVRLAIADKAKFKLAAEGKMIAKGPTVKDRNARVERAILKSLPQVISSIEEEQNSQETPKVAALQKKALADFKPKSSDTHRSDKRRKNLRSKKDPKSVLKKQYLLAKKVLKFKRLKIVGTEVGDYEVSVTFKSVEGLENVVNLTKMCVLCTCEIHADKYFCPEIV